MRIVIFSDMNVFDYCIVRANMSASEDDRLSKEELLGQMS